MDNVIFNLAGMHRYGAAFYDYLRLRKRFFVDQLGWDLPHDNDVEMDQYDNPRAWYSLVLNGAGEIVGGARAMPTSTRWGAHTYMLGDAKLGKLGSIPPNVMPSQLASSKVWECTRLVMSDGLCKQADRSECLSLIVGGLVELASREGATELISLSPVTLMRALRQLGFAAERRGESYHNDGDGRQYAVLAMPACPARPHLSRMAAAGLPPAAHRGIPMTVHSPQKD